MRRWFISDDKALSITAKEAIETSASGVYLSVASLWEIAIKISLGKLDLPTPLDEFLSQQLRDNDIMLLPIEVKHIGTVARLPFHHRDPFDRLIIAQSLSEELTLLSRDAAFDAYGVKRRWQND